VFSINRECEFTHDNGTALTRLYENVFADFNQLRSKDPAAHERHGACPGGSLTFALVEQSRHARYRSSRRYRVECHGALTVRGAVEAPRVAGRIFRYNPDVRTGDATFLPVQQFRSRGILCPEDECDVMSRGRRYIEDGDVAISACRREESDY